MTIEFSLRRRATQARCLAALWLSLAVVILVATYISLPLVANKTLSSISQILGQSLGANSSATADALEAETFFHVQLFAMGTLVLGLFAVSFACFLLSRSAFVEIELAARFSGLADALCLAGDNFEHLEKTLNLFVPRAKYLSAPGMFSAKDLKPLAEILKHVQKS